MVDLLAAWVLYPLALGVACLGLALLVERLTAWPTPGALLLPVGFVTLVALARLITAYELTARFALPVIGFGAVAGLVLGRARVLALRPDPWLLGAVAGVFAVLAAPVVLSGSVTFAGYLALPDTAHQLVLADLYAHHGPDWASLAPGSFRQSAKNYVETAYPVAGQAALGVTAPLGAIDLAWLYQPFLAFALLAAGLAVWALSARVLARRWHAAIVTFAAALPALVVGNYVTGSIKEITGLAALLTLVAALAAAIDARRPARSLAVLAIAAAAALGALGPAAIAYLAVPAAVVAGRWVVALLRRPARAEAAALAGGALLLAVLALPMLLTLRTAVNAGNAALSGGGGAAVADGSPDAALGHLAAPLQTAQALGVWLTGDFRYAPEGAAQTVTTILLVLAAAAALGGVAWAVRHRHAGLLLLIGTFLPASLVLLQRGTPYADSKVLMLASPALLALALLGAGALGGGRLRALGTLATAALLGGVLASAALAYHDVSLAPHARYAELAKIDDRLAGRGPALFGEYDEFAKYFLRDVPVLSAPEAAQQYRGAPYHPNALRDRRRRPSAKTGIDVDDLTLRYLESVPYIVLRRGPQTSRPPANFTLASRGRWYDIWRRTPAPRVIDHLPLGPDVLHQAARVSAPVARDWARRARARRGRIAFVVRLRPAVYLETRDRARPLLWTGYGNFPGALVTGGPANIHGPVTIPRSGLYDVWVEGSFGRRLTLGLDGTPFPDRPQGLNNPGGYESLGTVAIARGRHEIFIRQGGADLHPGTAGYRSSLRHLGPVFFDPVANRRPTVRTIDPARWRELVGERADWLEIVGQA